MPLDSKEVAASVNDPNKLYTLSLWANNTTTLVNNQGATKIGRTLNGYTYYEWDITGTSSINLSTNSAVNIDELRIYPKDAQMTTYTYAPLVGITSQTDANNRIMYYIYDGFNRLLLVRDQDKNILKKYCYNYQGQTQNCQVFGNQDQSGTFYSQNCTSGQTPVGIYVTIPANQYYSTTSQAVANAQAQQYGQNYANQNGTCITQNFTLNYGNYTGSNGNYTVELYNTGTGQSYSYQMGNGSGILGSIVPGNYNISIYNNSDYNIRSFSAGCGYYASGYGSATMYNVPLAAGCDYIEIF